MKTQFQVPQVLADGEIQKIVQSALKILSQVPLTVDGTEEFSQALLDFGCRVDNKKIFFPKPVIDKLLGRSASNKQNQNSCRELPDKIIPYVSGQGSLIADTRTDHIRPANTGDLADLARFLDALGPEVGWCHPTFIPADKPIKTREIHAFATICLNHSKPSRVSPYSPPAVEYMADILKVCLGSMEKVKANAGLIAHKLWFNTPFMIGRETIEGMMLSRKLLGHKIGITIMPVAGAATPITPSGCLALVTAEVLAANIISLALDDCLVGFCSSPLTMDLRVGAHLEQDPYTDLLRIGAEQVRTHIFGGPPGCSAFAPRTAAKVPGEQAMMEKTFGAFLHIIGGGRGFNSVGTLSYGDIASMVQILLDLELTGYLNRLLQGLNCEGEDRLAETVNLNVIPEGARFMEHEHTLEFFRREQWYPDFLDRRVANAWVADPKTMLDNARQKALTLLSTAPNLCPLTVNQKQEIQNILAEADRRLAP
jgi:trimethylamine---corrinoid protein Co-methyltransferase